MGFGIAQQFANSPINRRIRQFSVSTTGTVTEIATGSSCLMWRIKANGGNSGEIRISTLGDGTQFYVIEAGDDIGWIPGTLQGYYWHGDTANDSFYVWELE